MTTTPLSPADLDAAMILLRDHDATIEQRVVIHSYTSWGHSAPDGWYRAEFKHGWGERFGATEREVRGALRDHPDATRALLYQAARVAVVTAMLRDDHAAALAALDAALVYGPATEEDVLLRALITDAEVDEATRAALRDHIEAQTLLEVLKDATGSDKSPANGARCLRLLDRAVHLIGEPAPRYVDTLRANFTEVAGDLRGAITLHESRLLRPERYEHEHEHVKQRLALLHKQLSKQ